LQITAEHPLLGTGWGKPEPLFGHYYMPPKLNESAAIEMNDYFMLGANTWNSRAILFLHVSLAVVDSKKRKAESRKQKFERPTGCKRRVAPAQSYCSLVSGLTEDYSNCPPPQHFGFCWNWAQPHLHNHTL